MKINKVKKVNNSKRWRPIPRYEGLYKISNYGDILSLKRIYHCGRKHARKVVCGNKTRKQAMVQGYKSINLCKNGKQTFITIHRLVAMTFVPNPQKKPEVNHKDGVKTNNFYKNLEWVTEKENSDHAINLGLCDSFYGENNVRAKLSNKEVVKIRTIYKTGKYNKSELARKYNVSHTQIIKIINYRARTRG